MAQVFELKLRSLPTADYGRLDVRREVGEPDQHPLVRAFWRLMKAPGFVDAPIQNRMRLSQSPNEDGVVSRRSKTA